MEGRSKIKNWVLLENSLTDFDEENICFINQKEHFQKKVRICLDKK